jgi:hypothetical protein
VVFQNTYVTKGTKGNLADLPYWVTVSVDIVQIINLLIFLTRELNTRAVAGVADLVRKPDTVARWGGAGKVPSGVCFVKELAAVQGLWMIEQHGR